jgi:hypothetical protein
MFFGRSEKKRKGREKGVAKRGSHARIIYNSTNNCKISLSIETCNNGGNIMGYHGNSKLFSNFGVNNIVLRIIRILSNYLSEFKKKSSRLL